MCLYNNGKPPLCRGSKYVVTKGRIILLKLLIINNKEDFFIIGSGGLVWFMVFNTTFSYIVAISFIGGGNHRPVVSH